MTSNKLKKSSRKIKITKNYVRIISFFFNINYQYSKIILLISNQIQLKKLKKTKNLYIFN